MTLYTCPYCGESKESTAGCCVEGYRQKLLKKILRGYGLSKYLDDDHEEICEKCGFVHINQDRCPTREDLRALALAEEAFNTEFDVLQKQRKLTP